MDSVFGSREIASVCSGWVAVVIALMSASSSRSRRPRTAIDRNAGPPVFWEPVSPRSARASVNSCGNLPVRFRQHQHRVPDPAGQRLRLGAGQIPMPNQPGGGVWVRGVGGEVTIKSNSDLDRRRSRDRCRRTRGGQRQHELRRPVGAPDVRRRPGRGRHRRLNWNGWNCTLVPTAGYLGARDANDNVGGSRSPTVTKCRSRALIWW